VPLLRRFFFFRKFPLDSPVFIFFLFFRSLPRRFFWRVLAHVELLLLLLLLLLLGTGFWGDAVNLRYVNIVSESTCGVMLGLRITSSIVTLASG